jgi:hypothetical protein
MYDLVPEGPGKRQPWFTLQLELRIALSARQPDLAGRIATMTELIQRRFGDKVDLDMKRFENLGPMCRNWVDVWRWSTERKESVAPPVHLVPAR